MPKPEDRFKARILKDLKSYPGKWFATPRSRYATAGVSDIIGCYFGLFMAVEIKRPDGVGYYGVTPTQQRFLDAVVNNGGWSFVVEDNVSYTAFKAVLGQTWRLKDPQGWAASLEGQGQQHV